MEETQNSEELKTMLESIHKAIELYNGLNPKEKVILAPQTEKKDVRDIFICVYNDEHVGLFKKIGWRGWNEKDCDYDYVWSWIEYDSGNVYLGIDSDYVGVQKTYEGTEWQQAGTEVIIDGKSYVANCNMKNAMSFNDMRLIMYNEGKIGPYEIGKASSEEILEVLKYAYSYYRLGQNNKRKRLG